MRRNTSINNFSVLTCSKSMCKIKLGLRESHTGDPLPCEPIYAGIAQREQEYLIEQGFYWVDGMGWVEDEAEEVVHLFASDTPLHDAHMRAQADEIDALNLLPF